MSGSSTATVAEIICLYRDEKLSMRQVSDKTGATYDVVRNTIRRQKIARRPRGRYLSISDAKASAIVKACTSGGMSHADAARKHHCTVATVQNLLRKRNLIPKPGADYVLAGEAAAIIGVTVGYVSFLAHHGKIGYKRATARGRMLYSKADAEALAAKRAARQS